MENNWIFTEAEVEQSPSRKQMTAEEEAKARREVCAYIQYVGEILRFPQVTIATAMLFIHRFYMRKSLKQYHRREMATAALFLAGKVEETPKKLRDVLCTCLEADAKMTGRKLPIPAEDTKEFADIRSRTLTNERLLLEMLCYDLQSTHPYRFLFDYIKMTNAPRSVLHAAWCFITDSYMTPVCLLFTPDQIARAAFYLGVRTVGHTFVQEEEKEAWSKVEDASDASLKPIISHILNVMPAPNLNDPNAPPSKVPAITPPVQ